MRIRGVFALIILACVGFCADDYTDAIVGFSFVRLPGWALSPHAPVLGGPGQCVGVSDPDAPSPEFINICGKPNNTEPGKIEQGLRSGLANYISATGARWGTELRLRSGSVIMTEISGTKALSAVLEYTMGGKAGVSYIVWFQTDKTRLSLIGETDPSNLENMIARLRPIRDSIRIP
jgi:hypothetical protein